MTVATYAWRRLDLEGITRELRLDGLQDEDVVDIAGNPFTNALVLRPPGRSRGWPN